MKKHNSFHSLFLTLIALCAAALTASNAFASEADLLEVQKRAKEIVPALADAPNYGAREKGREFWDRLGAAGNKKRMVEAAESFAKEPLTPLTEELYKEYYKNGVRDNYQGPFFHLQSRLNAFNLAEQYENEGRFIDALNEIVLYWCSFPSWVLPAHDAVAIVYDGKQVYSDLGATLLGGDIAIAVNLHEDKLPPETVKLAKAEIERRLLKPYREAVRDEARAGMFWVRVVSNWNAVCHAGTIAAALNIVDSKEDRAFFLAAADYFSEKYFLKSFTNDGYCSEGLGYWDYGFGNYITLGALARNATQGKLDMFRFTCIRPILSFAPTLELDAGAFVAFADCSMAAKPSPLYVGYLSRLKGYGFYDYERRGLGKNYLGNSPLSVAAFGYDEDVTLAEPGDEKDFVLPIRTDFPDAGVTICRPDPSAKGAYFAVAFKGGHNNELHNHNDVGSYSLVLGNKADANSQAFFVCRDPGGETYTARTFSSRRYEGQLLNSFGHPVPRVSGVLQSPGGQAKGQVVEKSFADGVDSVTLDIRSAYNVPTLQTLTRQFEFGRAKGDDPGYFQVVDSAKFEDGKADTFETAIVTFEKVELEQQGDAVLVKIGNADAIVTAKDADGNAQRVVAETAIVGENDDSAKNKPTRVALKVEGKVNSTVVTTRYQPAAKK